QSGGWGSLVLRLSSGFDAIFLVLSKHRRNNGWYSMTSSLRGHRAEGNPRMSSSEYTREPGHTTLSHDRQSVPLPSSARLSWRVISRERRWIPPPCIIKI